MGSAAGALRPICQPWQQALRVILVRARQPCHPLLRLHILQAHRAHLHPRPAPPQRLSPPAAPLRIRSCRPKHRRPSGCALESRVPPNSGAASGGGRRSRWAVGAVHALKLLLEAETRGQGRLAHRRRGRQPVREGEPRQGRRIRRPRPAVEAMVQPALPSQLHSRQHHIPISLWFLPFLSETAFFSSPILYLSLRRWIRNPNYTQVLQ